MSDGKKKLTHEDLACLAPGEVYLLGEPKPLQEFDQEPISLPTPAHQAIATRFGGWEVTNVFDPSFLELNILKKAHRDEKALRRVKLLKKPYGGIRCEGETHTPPACHRCHGTGFVDGYKKQKNSPSITCWKEKSSLGFSFLACYYRHFSPGDLVEVQERLYMVENVTSDSDYNCWDVFVVVLPPDDFRYEVLSCHAETSISK